MIGPSLLCKDVMIQLNVDGVLQCQAKKKEDLTAAIRANQAAVDAAKSPQREAAEGYNGMIGIGDRLEMLTYVHYNIRPRR